LKIRRIPISISINILSSLKRLDLLIKFFQIVKIPILKTSVKTQKYELN